MSETVSSFELTLEQLDGYEFKVGFDKAWEGWHTDEPPPLGKDAGPNPARVLAVSIANCLAASLIFCLSKKGEKVSGVTAKARLELVRSRTRTPIAHATRLGGPSGSLTTVTIEPGVVMKFEPEIALQIQHFTTDEPSTAALRAVGTPEKPIVTNTTFSNIAGHGVTQGFDGSLVDFRTSNTFTNVSGCEQTRPRNPDTTCPDPRPVCD